MSTSIRIRLLLLLLALGLTRPFVLGAQQGEPGSRQPDEASAVRRVCFRPRPLANCRAFVITEFGLGRMLTPPRTIQDTIPGSASPAGIGTDEIRYDPPSANHWNPEPSYFLHWEFGGMLNTDEERAIGLSAFIAVPITGASEEEYGIRARHRWWNHNGWIVDLGPSLFLTRSYDRIVDIPAPSLRPGAAIRGSVSTQSEWFGITGELNLTPGHVGLQVGGRLSGLPGLAAGIATPIIVVIGLSAEE